MNTDEVITLVAEANALLDRMEDLLHNIGGGTKSRWRNEYEGV